MSILGSIHKWHQPIFGQFWPCLHLSITVKLWINDPLPLSFEVYFPSNKKLSECPHCLPCLYTVPFISIIVSKVRIFCLQSLKYAKPSNHLPWLELHLFQLRFFISNEACINMNFFTELINIIFIIGYCFWVQFNL